MSTLVVTVIFTVYPFSRHNQIFVADEIRKLSETSSEQSRNIGTQLTKIHSAIEEMVSEESNRVFSSVSQKIATALHTMNNSTLEVRTASAEMSEGNKLILQEIKKLQVATDQMDESMSYMKNESQKIFEKAKSLSDINERMEATIHDISLRIEQFKV